MDVKLVLLFISLSVSGAIASKANCAYYDSENYGYHCELRYEDVEDASIFTEVGGEHETGKTDNDVLGIYAYSDVRQPDLPAFLCRKYPNLQRLFFQRLVIRELPENSFTACRNLKELTLQSPVFASSSIKKLPQNLIIGNTKLRVFEAKLYTLQSLPQDFFINSQNLEKVDLGDNKLNSLPGNIFQPLVNLKELLLPRNKIRRLNANWFSSLEKLEVLFLNENDISEIFEGTFSKLGQLKELWLSFNNIKAIHAGAFGVHPHLDQINLMNNKIEYIEEAFIDNVAVTNLNIYYNTCINDHIIDSSAEKSVLKKKLASCFSISNVGVRVDSEPDETTRRSAFDIDQTEGEKLMMGFMLMFNQLRDAFEKNKAEQSTAEPARDISVNA